ncbi:hypothetical protein GEMRC1_009683 [Eukaryota sp. GEM-RC1]
MDCPLQPIRLQFSSLVLVNYLFIKRIFTSSLEEDLWDPSFPFLRLTKELLFFFENLGYVSQRFFDSTYPSLQVFFETNTFPIASEQLSQLLSLASFIGANVRSLFLHVDS